jgi:MFS family permease
MIWNVGFVFYLGFAPFSLVDHGIGIVRAGFIASLPAWVSLISVPLGEYLIDRTGKANLPIAGAILGSGLNVCLLPFGPIPALAILIGVLRGSCAGGVNALVGGVLRRESRSVGMGLYHTILYLGMAVMPPVAGHLKDLAGNSAVPLIFSGILIILTILPFAAFRVLQGRWSNDKEFVDWLE